MRIFAILLILSSLPVFLALLRSPAARPWLFVALGALPILHLPLNVDAALISWATWVGHTKGLLVTLLDMLALAICLRYASSRAAPPFLWLFVVYLVSQVPGLFVGQLFQPAAFFFLHTAKLTFVFYAVYLVVARGELVRIVQGLSLAVISNAVVAFSNSLSGFSQAQGLLGHQNLTGMAVNLSVPILVAFGLRKNGGFFLVAAAAGGVSAVAGGSRATILLYGISVVATLLGSTLLNSTTRKTTIGFVALLGLLAASPLALQKLADRSQGGGIDLRTDSERSAFESAAKMMIADYPWGVGYNQYVIAANTGGYLDRAGVRWQVNARSTMVHNAYLVSRAEGGLIGLFGLLSWLLLPILAALKGAIHKRGPLREVNMAIAVALAVTAVHGLYEWILLTIVPQYLIALMIGVVAASFAARKQALGLPKSAAPASNPAFAPGVPRPVAHVKTASPRRAAD